MNLHANKTFTNMQIYVFYTNMKPEDVRLFLDIEISALKGILFFPSAQLPKTKAKLKMLDSVNSHTSKVTNLFLQNYF